MNDNDQPDELHEKTRNYRVVQCLDGSALADRRTVAEEIAALLLSEQELSGEVRKGLADAILRGLEKPHAEDTDRRIRLSIVDHSVWREWSGLVLTRRRWIDAVAEEKQEAVLGNKSTELSLAIARRHLMGIDMMKKARQFFNEFISEFDDPSSRLRTFLDNEGHSNLLESGCDDDFFWCARGAYAERRADEKLGTGFSGQQ